MRRDAGRTTQDAQRLTRYQADLHIHTLLSPCAEIEMIPSLIVAAAGLAGLDIIGIADHNSCDNAGAVIEASAGSGIRVLPGLEVQSLEGVHLLCLFDTMDQARAMQETIYASLPSPSPGGEGRGEGAYAPRYRKIFEQQLIVDGNDEFVSYCERLIGFPTSLEIEEIYGRVDELGGILIPSHIDRHETGICGVLGMLPETPIFEAVEISPNLTSDQARSVYALGRKPILHSSDAHWLSAIGEHRTALHLEHRTVAEIRMACRGEGGRMVENA